MNRNRYLQLFGVCEQQLRDLVNEGMKAIAEDGTMDAIGKNYPDIYENLTMINN